MSFSSSSYHSPCTLLDTVAMTISISATSITLSTRRAAPTRRSAISTSCLPVLPVPPSTAALSAKKMARDTRVNIGSPSFKLFDNILDTTAFLVCSFSRFTAWSSSLGSLMMASTISVIPTSSTLSSSSDSCLVDAEIIASMSNGLVTSCSLSRVCRRTSMLVEMTMIFWNSD
uniref:Uncharacterized protein n=1 Tax=Opuntia streptacantha TaxID=393608 RepID=A0A7C9B3M3_OPUST